MLSISKSKYRSLIWKENGFIVHQVTLFNMPVSYIKSFFLSNIKYSSYFCLYVYTKCVMFAWVNMCCAKQIPPCMGVCEFMCTYLCVLLWGPPALWYTNTQTQTFTHKQLGLNEAELSLVPISLIINNFSLPPNTLINLQRRLCVRVCVSVCACQCLCTLADKRCGW